MKTLISIITLIAIVFAYFIASSFYVQGQFMVAYSLVLGSLVSVVFWIKSHDLLKVATVKAA